MSIDALDFINALSLDERCSVINNAVRKKIIDPELRGEAFNSWQIRKSSLTIEQKNQINSMRGYSNEIISMAMEPKTNNQICQLLAEFVYDSKWFKKYRKCVENYQFGEVQENGYSLLYAPFVKVYYDNLISILATYPIFASEVISSLLETVSSAYHNLCIRCLILELHESDGFDDAGDSNEAALKDFLARYQHQDRLLNFYAKYPSLTRRLVEASDRYIEFTKEVICNIAYAKTRLNLVDGEKIVSLRMGAGDTHCGGKTAVKVVTSQENVFFYKPHGMEVESVFVNIVNLLNQDAEVLALKLAENIDFGDFTISKEVKQAPCNTQEEVRRAYLRYGELIALSYVFNFTDLHMENIVVDKEDPVIVDGETFLANRLPLQLEGFPKAATQIMRETTGYVTNSILLPTQIYIDSSRKAVDLGAISAGEQELENVLVLKDPDSIKVRFERDKVTLPKAKNKVTAVDDSVDYSAFIEDILLGFDIMIKAIGNNRDKIQGILEESSTLNSRILIRPTSSYARLLEFCLHPTCMIDRRESDKILENMYALPGLHAEIFLAEYGAMLAGDVPYFTAQVGGRDLLAANSSVIPNVLDKTALSEVILRLDNFGSEVVERQRTLIEAKIASDRFDIVPPADNGDCFLSNEATSSTALLKEAIDIAEYIVSSATYASDDKTIGFVSLDENHDNSPLPLHFDVHSGLSGIAIVMLRLAQLTNNIKFLDFADQLYETVNMPATSYSQGISAYVGPTAPVTLSLYRPEFMGYCHSHARSLRKSMKLLADFSQSDKLLDFSWLTGCASFLPLLTKYFDTSKDERYLISASSLADRLIDNIEGDHLEGWGMAHGKLGAIVALAGFGVQSGSDRHADFAVSQLKMIISHSPSELLEFRSFCRGSAGLIHAVSQAVDLNLLPPEELDNCVDKVGFMQPLLMRGDCLCHGNSSVIDAAVSAYQASNNEEYLDYAQKVGAAMLARKAEQGHFSIKRYPGFPDVGLFTSTSGIAYTLMRLVDQNIPSIAMLR